ncbi:DRMBL-domain-containing protein [Aureobasidium pullulans]|uniref:DRMBL-domain-containing protein n=3 Tax=Aureobasidium pullulans TaxID=5580 RepID=A0A4S9H126_AURPU|nr:DRMBL-domain-containing protein [Aureobasidium pullulans]TIA05772.1 DRMBL-domain-containing protein [Aureobasidium pullulans]TIA28592.1 DRMBL-domain-containing protein [Aureobasidium pullulans]
MATRTMPSRSSSGSKQPKISTFAKGNANTKKSASAKDSKPKGKPNGSILSFFKKDDGLFVANPASSPAKGQERVEEIEVEEEQESRFNEEDGPIKRRKLSPIEVVEEANPTSPVPTPVAEPKAVPIVKTTSGPFMEESDSEEEDDDTKPSIAPIAPAIIKAEAKQPPSLIHQPTSASVAEEDNFGDFEGTDDFEDDVFDEGEEYVERLWMEQEQIKLENGDDDSFQDDEIKTPEADAPSCPICSVNLAGVAESDAGVHVNNCLDGNPTPLPEQKEKPPPTALSPARFKKPVRPAKPAQSQPSGNDSSSSAFSKLMTSRSEDMAWANAAAAENASRGKPSYTRTCPFYKILPGTNIAVDAFRYGAVAGCNAYFLSHFHSDHYVGLTSTWTHGPIYCSKVTANLVKQQLRVNPEYVVALDWEVPFEVPGTPGVTVTMISANHCPGSSLYLFEKPLSKGPDPKLHRVLHCGDFRACRMHLEHPLLRPDVQDHITGKNKEQKIDVCYLDTTYLSPKYSFPEQEDVIKACADMCVRYNDDPLVLDSLKSESASMAKFVRQDSQPTLKQEDSDMKIKQEPSDSTELKLHNNGKLTSTKAARLLVVVGTYSIGKERICIGIAKALGSKIFAPAGKQRICRALEDPELSGLLTTDPREAQVHMTPIFEIRADTLDDYRQGYADHFDRCIGFRPSGWNYKPPSSRLDTPNVSNILYSTSWKSAYSIKDLSPQRGSTNRAKCFGVPYSEHSSFRELTMFCTALRVEKIIPTVNVGSGKGRERMKGWADRWIAHREKNGCFEVKDW